MNDQLTDKQERVCRLVHAGLQNHEIAEELGISKNTVISYLIQIRLKLGLDHRLAIALWYERNRASKS